MKRIYFYVVKDYLYSIEASFDDEYEYDNKHVLCGPFNTITEAKKVAKDIMQEEAQNLIYSRRDIAETRKHRLISDLLKRG